MENATKVLNTGLKFVKVGKTLMWVLLGAVVLLLLIIIIAGASFGGEYIPLCLTMQIDYSSYAFVNVLVVLSYIGIIAGLVGVKLYFWGMHYIGLGQTACNTLPEKGSCN